MSRVKDPIASTVSSLSAGHVPVSVATRLSSDIVIVGDKAHPFPYSTRKPFETTGTENSTRIGVFVATFVAPSVGVTDTTAKGTWLVVRNRLVNGAGCRRKTSKIDPGTTIVISVSTGSG